MRSIHEWFASYADDHRNPTNRMLHWICVPTIMWTVIAALWTAPPILPDWFRPGLWSVIAMFCAYGFYHRLSRNLAYGMAIAFIAGGAIAWALYGAIGPRRLLILAAVLFALAWIGQFAGHTIEGRHPAFFTNVIQLLIGPAWLMGKLMHRLGITY
jgi:uncharacterized membrane protein YGL010W